MRDGRYKCEACGRGFADGDKADAHVRSSHGKMPELDPRKTQLRKTLWELRNAVRGGELGLALDVAREDLRGQVPDGSLALLVRALRGGNARLALGWANARLRPLEGSGKRGRRARGR